MSGAMTAEEVEYWTNSMNHEDASSSSNIQFHDGVGGGNGLEIRYIMMFGVLGVLCAALVMYVIFSMIQNVAFDDLTDEEWSQANDSDAGANSSLLANSDGCCVLCEKNTTGKGSEWQTTGLGGCGYLTCHDCFVGYVPLKERCVVCGQFYCYRRDRVTFIDLQREEGDSQKDSSKVKKSGHFSSPYDSGDDDQNMIGKQSAQDKEDGLRRRVVQ